MVGPSRRAPSDVSAQDREWLVGRQGDLLLKWLLGGGCPNPEHGVRGADASEHRDRGRALNFFFDWSSAGQDTTGFDKDVCVVWSPRGVAQKSHTQLVGQERVLVHLEIAGGGSANAKVQNFKIGIHTRKPG